MQWLDVGSIYPIADHSWVCPFKCVSLKGRMIVVPHERNEFVRMRLVTGWRFYMDYRNLNAWAKKDHFSMTFIDKMLNRRATKCWYFFIDGYLGYNQISIAS